MVGESVTAEYCLGRAQGLQNCDIIVMCWGWCIAMLYVMLPAAGYCEILLYFPRDVMQPPV